MVARVLLVIIVCFFSVELLAHGMSAADQAKALNAGYFDYIKLGGKHMLTGYDHLLFLLGVIFFLTRFSDIIKFITAFTIGHSITLIFATLLGIKANYYLIDAVIALTVCYKAFDNLQGFKHFLKIPAPNLMWMVFIFGLIHGFGLSTRLQQLPSGVDSWIGKIIAFNVGVELGQIVALSVMLLLLITFRKVVSEQYEYACSKIINIGLMCAGALLLLMQLHSYLHEHHPYDFPLNSDDHEHIHEDWAKQQLPHSH